MLNILVVYGLGFGTAVAAKVVGPRIAQRARPLARGAIRQSMLLNRELQRVAEEARASVEDLVAEARDELEQTESAPDPRS